MKTIEVELKGTSPLIMHSCVGVNKLHPLTIALDRLNGKRKKTEEDFRKISDLEWEIGIYWDDQVGLYLPAENIEATIREGAKSFKKGKTFERGFNCINMLNPVDIGENLTKDQMFADFRFRDVRAMRVQTNRIMRTRPRFNMWRCTFRACYDERSLDFKDIVNAIDYAGEKVGLCDSRPRYGTFVSTITELD